MYWWILKNQIFPLDGLIFIETNFRCYYRTYPRIIRDHLLQITRVSFSLTHFQPMVHFCTPWKHQKTSGFMLSGVIEVEHWLKMDFKNLRFLKALTFLICRVVMLEVLNEILTHKQKNLVYGELWMSCNLNSFLIWSNTRGCRYFLHKNLLTWSVQFISIFEKSTKNWILKSLSQDLVLT